MGEHRPRETEGNGRGTPGSGPVKTVFLLQDLKFGGTQRQAIELASRIDPSRFSIRLWLMAEGDDFLPRVGELKLPVHWLSREKRVGFESLVNLWRSLLRERIDLLVLWTVVPNIWGRILGRLTGTRHIVGTCRGGASPARQHEGLLSTLADHHICNSTALGNAYLGRYRVPKTRVSMIPNGIDAPPGPHRVHAASSNPGVILSVARLVPDKDHDTLIRAFDIVARRHPGVELRIVGDGPRRQAVENLVRRAGLSQRVRFLPGRLDPFPLYGESDIFVLSSHREGLPNVILEAMAAGLPVVASAVGGIPEVVRHGRTGWLVPSEDPGAMADALERLLSDGRTRSAFGDAGRRLVEEEYSMSRMVRCHVEIFEKITGGRSRT
ncbi:MAG: glycosyltransferase [Syntrophobacteraceae bacterium]